MKALAGVAGAGIVAVTGSAIYTWTIRTGPASGACVDRYGCRIGGRLIGVGTALIEAGDRLVESGHRSAVTRQAFKLPEPAAVHAMKSFAVVVAKWFFRPQKQQ